MSTITIIAIISLLETIVTILRIAIIANGVALILAHFNLDTSDKKSHTDKSPTNEERCMKREATDTESCYPAKRAKWLPFFSLRPFVLKRKISDCEEEPAAGAVMKRSRQFPAFIQLTRVSFIKEIREKNCTQELKENLKPPRKKVTFADKVQILVFCKHEPIVSKPILGKRSSVVLDTAGSYPKKVKTIGFFGLHDTKSVLGKRKLADTGSFFSKKVKK